MTLNKKILKIIIEKLQVLFAFIIFALLLAVGFVYLYLNTRPYSERVKELKDKGYTQTQVDSIIKDEDESFQRTKFIWMMDSY